MVPRLGCTGCGSQCGLGTSVQEGMPTIRDRHDKRAHAYGGKSAMSTGNQVGMLGAMGEDNAGAVGYSVVGTSR